MPAACASSAWACMRWAGKVRHVRLAGSGVCHGSTVSEGGNTRFHRSGCSPSSSGVTGTARGVPPTVAVTTTCASARRAGQSTTCGKSARVPRAPSGVSRWVTNNDRCRGCAGSALIGSAVTRKDSVAIAHTPANAAQ